MSPLLANVALSTLDDHFAQRWNETMGTANLRAQRRYHGEATYRLIRYADDFVVVVKGERRHAEQLRGEVAAVLARIGLRLSPAKTQVVHIDDGFDFLGFHIRRMRKRGTTKSFVYTKPSKKAIASIKGKVRTMTYKGKVTNGTVVLPPDAHIPEGTEVEVTPVASPSNGGSELRESPTLYETLQNFVGIFEGLPSDFAENHDHYIHGAPKRK